MAITQITSTGIADNAVVTAAINADAVTAAKIGADQIGSSELNLGANYAFTGTITGAGELTPAFRAYASSDQTFANNTQTVCAFNAEEFDTDSAYNTSTYKFTPQTAGWYFIGAIWGTGNGTAANLTMQTAITKNGGTHVRNFFTVGNTSNVSSYIASIIQFNGSSDYVQLTGNHTHGGNATMDSSSPLNYFFGFRIPGI
ncbi:MAG: hypothetical protein VX199_02600 [Chloroflexota bacterium]|nr:hypothetical protein [Chloroflexota bacterium]